MVYRSVMGGVEDLHLTASSSVGYPKGRMNRAEFTSELERLLRTFEDDAPSTNCINSTNLKACSMCMFSDGLESCYRCTHSHDSVHCSNLSHSSGCDGCHSSAYLINCKHCTGSAYLINSTNCSDSTYCFGCVGLVKKDFHILNVAYSRKEYFDRVTKLKRELGIR